MAFVQRIVAADSSVLIQKVTVRPVTTLCSAALEAGRRPRAAVGCPFEDQWIQHRLNRGPCLDEFPRIVCVSKIGCPDATENGSRGRVQQHASALSVQHVLKVSRSASDGSKVAAMSGSPVGTAVLKSRVGLDELEIDGLTRERFHRRIDRPRVASTRVLRWFANARKRANLKKRRIEEIEEEERPCSTN